MRHVFVPVLGGIGSPQTLAIIKALQGVEGVYAWSPCRSNEYTADLVQAVQIYPADAVALIGHSLACDTVIDTCIHLQKLGRPVDYACVIEPVWADKKNPGALIFDWFRCDRLIDFPKANVDGQTVTVVRGTDHNSICQNAQVINTIVERVRSLRGTP